MKTNAFKSLYVMAAILAVFSTLVSCEEISFSDEIFISTSDQSALQVSPRALAFERGESSKTVTVTSEEGWSFKTNDAWIHVSRDADSDKLTIQLDENRARETRVSSLTIYALNDPDKKTNVSISQKTTLVTVSGSETELNFSAYEGAYNNLTIHSNGEWHVSSTPDWLRPSISGGNGEKLLSFTTLSKNKTAADRTGVVVVKTDDEEFRINVKQYGAAAPNCQVTPKHITVLSNGIAFDYDYSLAEHVAYYHRGYIEASEAGRMTYDEIILTLRTKFQRHLPSEHEIAVFPDLKPKTSYLIYTLAFDMDNKMGELLSTEIKTSGVEVNEPRASISSIECTGPYWEWKITMSAPCDSYWMMTTENQEVALSPDVLQAWWIEDAIRHNKLTEYSNGGVWQQKRGGNMIAVWTRGMTKKGIWSGVIDWKGCELSSTTTTRSGSPLVVTREIGKQKQVARDQSGKALSPDQYKLYMLQ